MLLGDNSSESLNRNISVEWNANASSCVARDGVPSGGIIDAMVA